MKKLLMAILLIGAGKAIGQQKTITTAEYKDIEVSGGFKVKLVPGTEGTITLSGPQKALDATTVECHDGTLEISSKGMSKSSSVTVTIPVNEICGLGLSGSGEITSNYVLKSDSFQLRLSGSGKIAVQIDSKKASALTSGSGNIFIGGNSTQFECGISGSGEIIADDLKTQNVTAQISGSGNCRVYCDGALKAQIAGSGNVKYKGNADAVEQDIVGSGNVIKA
ncbi:head GIN domain-containing protein [Flavobacterium silvaticum]|uniref:DUF2807 domain-containing protein n=1 Tax=Flavobacterium silvaticum TaxID=1852020 RepID=A0A972JGL7_9FLAO|nr:head GIN domain-containing protein [Flavobacterium silvaticum]NMH29174.1 DUF2807 domain-containing protein [Flavobacterium silvaticum]